MRFFKYRFDDKGLSLIRETKRETSSTARDNFSINIDDGRPVRCNGASVNVFVRNTAVYSLNVRGNVLYATCSDDGLEECEFTDEILWQWCFDRGVFSSVTELMRNSFVDEGIDALLGAISNHMKMEFFGGAFKFSEAEHDCLRRAARIIGCFYMDHTEVLSLFVAGGVKALVRRIVHESAPPSVNVF